MIRALFQILKLWLLSMTINYLWKHIVPTVMVLVSWGDSSLSPLKHMPFSDVRRLEMRELAREMFYFGYNNYLEHAFPQDELNPVYCSGRGHDWDNPYVCACVRACVCCASVYLHVLYVCLYVYFHFTFLHYLLQVQYQHQ